MTPFRQCMKLRTGAEIVFLLAGMRENNAAKLGFRVPNDHCFRIWEHR
jgi:hypothetical protein